MLAWELFVDDLLLRIRTPETRSVDCKSSVGRVEYIVRFSDFRPNAVGSKKIVCHDLLSPKLAAPGRYIWPCLRLALFNTFTEGPNRKKAVAN
jgi:hypothetical protein